MISTHPLVVVLLCSGVLILLPKAIAQKKLSNMKEFLLEDQIHKRQNDVQKSYNDEILRNMENTGVIYDIEPYEPENTPDELSAFMVDYANMRNDVILLDNSVETRTRKRGNFKVKKNQAIPDPPCSCVFSEKTEDLGENFYPRYIETRNCNGSRQQKCFHPYVCKESWYNLTILKVREQHEPILTQLPNKLGHHWVAGTLPVSVGCVCTSEYQAQLTHDSQNSLKWIH